MCGIDNKAIHIIPARYDANAPLPTPPTDVETPTYPEKEQPGFDSKLKPSNMGGSYTLWEDPAENESGIGLDYMNGKKQNASSQRNNPAEHVESVV